MESEKIIWKKSFTIILIANVVYIVLFYFITQFFTN